MNSPLELKRGNGAEYSTVAADYVYVNTTFDPEAVQMVLELVVYEVLPPNLPVKSTLTTAGWTCLGVLRDKKTKAVSVLNGSPRLLYLKDFLRTNRRNCRVEYQFSQLVMPVELHRIIPVDCPCGSADVFPGIFGEHLSRDPLRFLEIGVKDKAEVQFLPVCSIYINSCMLTLPDGFEDRLAADIRKRVRDEEDLVSEVTVNERRLKVATHNQWKFVNATRQGNSIALAAEGNYLQCNGILTVDNVYFCEKMALVFQLEYAVKISRPGKDDEIRYLVLGELVHPLEYSKVTNSFETAELVDELGCDVEKSVTEHYICSAYDLLRDPKWKVKLHCEVGPSQGAVANEKTRELMRVLEEHARLEDMRQQRVRELQAKEAQKDSELAEKERELQKKERALQKKMESQVPVATTKIQEKSSADDKSAGVPPKRDEQLLPFAYEEAKTIVIQDNPAESKVASANPATIPEESALREDETPAKQADRQSLIEAEKNDPLRAQTICIEFLSFAGGPEMTQTIPKRLAFSLKFFTYPASYTPFVYLRAGDLLELGRELPHWSNVAARDEQNKILKIQYDFDPSLDLDIPPEQQAEEFAKYLILHKLNVLAWDADSMLPVGAIAIPLLDLLRKGKRVQSVEQVYDVRTEEKGLAGKIRIKLTNMGRTVGEVKKERITRPTQQVAKGKTKVRSKPITKNDISRLPEMTKLAKRTTMGETMSKSMAGFGRLPFMGEREEKVADILQEDLTKYRTLSRTMMFSNMWARSLSASKSASVLYMLGQLVLFPVQFVNPENSATEFTISAEDPDGREQDISVVTDPDEWRFYCTREGFDVPSDWHMFSTPPVPRLLLKAREQVTVLFRILAFDPPKKRQRVFKVVIRNESDKTVTYKNDVVLVYKDTYYNSSMNIAVPEEKEVDIPLQAELPSEILSFVKKVVCGNSGVTARIVEGRICVNFVAPKAPNDTELLFFLFGDNYCYNTLCIVAVTARSYSCLDVSQVTGYSSLQHVVLSSIYTLCLAKVDNAAAVKHVELYTSNRTLAEIDPKFAKLLDLNPRSEIRVPIKVASLRVGKVNALIHCVGTGLC